jgi:quercetin dioxygenase-like cupin family protein
MRVIPDRSSSSSLADPACFTGRVWRTDYVEPADGNALSGSRFLYEPGARSFWHVHEREQVIIAEFGTGIVSWDGLAAPHVLNAGDWWHVEPGVPHWHGATPVAPFAHLAITAGGATIWLHEVSDDDFRAASPDDRSPRH